SPPGSWYWAVMVSSCCACGRSSLTPSTWGAYRLRRIKKRKSPPRGWGGEDAGQAVSGHSWVPRVLSAAAFSSSASAGESALTYATYRLANDLSPRERATCTAPLVVPIISASSLSRWVPYSEAPIPYVYWMAARCVGPRESTMARTAAHFF